MIPTSPCWECPRHLAGKSKNSRKCSRCDKRLALLDRMDYMATARGGLAGSIAFPGIGRRFEAAPLSTWDLIPS